MANTFMQSSTNEWIQPLRNAKWGARLYAFVYAVVTANLIIFPHCGFYDPSDFFHSVLKDIPIYALYIFWGVISLFMFVCWFVMNSEQIALFQPFESVGYVVLNEEVKPSFHRRLHSTRAPPFSA
ncbi:hypothetical protein [Marinomonas mediterranea]|jgi:hypothetical protein|uniref:Uncharacterized protein n=1 Tax=Marinomonas mediterranea (strain ATCC 700492 / JCM 21426 / NBRC 103028 / MMB-1) TaxID=717774 RepID=F2JW62_MARM1|nr:hypothetical protein [Marinomonas mediterranea]ADZ89450.1 hypothetical protein Marme_0146 [Marinomonas mediterranea MMB-1]WCN07546.1 hypothetical protein GV055_00720 [Marinomonas mediterranea]WCN11644.1 hypothetical protein GV054_00730 [Marinomonas mediterranea]WCN15702.1 hypothetical protein GV053_00720 [Marinomonas mediterranea MMB-1]